MLKDLEPQIAAEHVAGVDGYTESWTAESYSTASLGDLMESHQAAPNRPRFDQGAIRGNWLDLRVPYQDIRHVGSSGEYGAYYGTR